MLDGDGRDDLLFPMHERRVGTGFDVLDAGRSGLEALARRVRTSRADVVLWASATPGGGEPPPSLPEGTRALWWPTGHAPERSASRSARRARRGARAPRRQRGGRGRRSPAALALGRALRARARALVGGDGGGDDRGVRERRRRPRRGRPGGARSSRAGARGAGAPRGRGAARALRGTVATRGRARMARRGRDGAADRRRAALGRTRAARAGVGRRAARGGRCGGSALRLAAAARPVWTPAGGEPGLAEAIDAALERDDAVLRCARTRQGRGGGATASPRSAARLAASRSRCGGRARARRDRHFAWSRALRCSPGATSLA